MPSSCHRLDFLFRNGRTHIHTLLDFVAIPFVLVGAFKRMPVKTYLIFVTRSLNNEGAKDDCQPLPKGWILLVYHPVLWIFD